MKYETRYPLIRRQQRLTLCPLMLQSKYNKITIEQQHYVFKRLLAELDRDIDTRIKQREQDKINKLKSNVGPNLT